MPPLCSDTVAPGGYGSPPSGIGACILISVNSMPIFSKVSLTAEMIPCRALAMRLWGAARLNLYLWANHQPTNQPMEHQPSH